MPKDYSKTAGKLIDELGGNGWIMSALTTYYQTLANYMKWEDIGMVLATGCGSRRDIERSRFPQMAYEMGKGL